MTGHLPVSPVRVAHPDLDGVMTTVATTGGDHHPLESPERASPVSAKARAPSPRAARVATVDGVMIPPLTGPPPASLERAALVAADGPTITTLGHHPLASPERVAPAAVDGVMIPPLTGHPPASLERAALVAADGPTITPLTGHPLASPARVAQVEDLCGVKTPPTGHPLASPARVAQVVACGEALESLARVAQVVSLARAAQVVACGEALESLARAADLPTLET